MSYLRTVLLYSSILLSVLLSAGNLYAEPLAQDSDTVYNNDAEMISGYTTIVDEQGQIILQTGHQAYPGDQFINEDDTLYEIISVEGNVGKARVIGSYSSILPIYNVPAQAAPAEVPKPLIGIYHTHTDESYIPSDGRATERGKGSIMLVGDAFARRLKKLGYQVDHNKTLHDPHDANAYHRSRRTVMKMLKNQPVALFDVHRNSAPASAYRTTINGQEATKILLVVGRQNQSRITIQNYARQIKAATDARYKGLIRGIFIAHGNYNQDLSPRNILIEVGTQYSNREAAERSAALFADIVPSFLNSAAGGGVAQASPPGDDGTVGSFTTTDPVSPAYYDILWIVLALIAGAAVYLYLSTGSLKEAKQKLRNFVKYEFTNFLGPRRKRK
ncbi:MAG TPA: stage II sporulation protein P [Methylomusa anaerophila]|uniref:Stage II sporulation protein P n=1 Tax=Methylomusa anaerophila TaxID=1930071 RepID=A0A348AJS4_9FIRM|nr:stage II sporulation protein P [Methylomusa anaerophila]BBB91322.1 Stage II sporulation protein P [Methylomusa anaerophila]HML90503.1 stage II sporulation protein P [Methylomusa anaerophila]